MKKVLVGILILFILGAGLIMGILLVQQNQIFNQKAATPTGQATVSFQPSSATIQRNSPYAVNVYFNPAGIPISGISVRVTFSNLSVAASGIQISQALLSDGNWNCPIKSISSIGSTSQVDIACANTSGTGFTASTNTLLGTFNLTASQVPLQNPLTLSFDGTQSTITRKSDNQDILLTPSSTASFTIIDSIATSPTATPLLVFASPTATPTGLPLGSHTPTATPTTSPIATGSASPSATQMPIPVTGFDTPTIILGGGGAALLLISALALIF